MDILLTICVSHALLIAKCGNIAYKESFIVDVMKSYSCNCIRSQNASHILQHSHQYSHEDYVFRMENNQRVVVFSQKK